MKGKKIIALLVTSLILNTLFGLSSFSAPEPVEVVYGDFDQDGNVDSDDYAYMRQYLLGMISDDKIPKTADVDGDGNYDSDDYAYMRQYLLGMISVFPAQKSATPSPTSTPTSVSTYTPTNETTPTPTISSGPELYMIASNESSNIYKVTLNIKNIERFSGYQANLVYDPKVLKPINLDNSEFTSQSPVEAGSLLTKKYSPIDFAMHDLQNGVLNFGRAYIAISSYKSSGVSESSGTIGVIYFKMLKSEATQILLENCSTMPEAVSGTIISDWNGDLVLNYSVTSKISLVPSNTSVPSNTPVPSVTPTAAPGLFMNSEKVPSSNGLLKVTLNVSNIKNLAGYQVNLKYNPEILLPVNMDGSEFNDSSNIEPGTLFKNNDYSPLKLANHDLANGTLNFGTAYIDVNSYKKSTTLKTSGTIAVIYFTVLKHVPTEIELTDCETMPLAVSGTILYNWDCSQVFEYSVVKSLKIEPSSMTIPVPAT
ncbi:cohesin domain-containing protein [Pseudobacteroides cellulosolvens]|uniref:Cellulosome anchoring protein cohesin region n=1 Tax=Pseudobacteroides cellulosolvens ATCC 35603 = DSM 2933 TaxID=398512 RepID=A0A0L6JMI8_9FIRM|nr:cohesin domain-containing protein [Pseudobacteroides cellulosolvens]KNY27011.1 cellulosome anchoring protein cohesin region [Pseudobacteroides cellulosolvens ATCC 35603 = DSM 2933]